MEFLSKVFSLWIVLFVCDTFPVSAQYVCSTTSGTGTGTRKGGRGKIIKVGQRTLDESIHQSTPLSQSINRLVRCRSPSRTRVRVGWGSALNNMVLSPSFSSS